MSNLDDTLNRMAERPSAELTKEDVQRWHIVFGAMPFAGDLWPHRTPETFADVTLMLGRLAETLRRYGDFHNELVAEHNALTRDVDAFRRILGTNNGEAGK